MAATAIAVAAHALLLLGLPRLTSPATRADLDASAFSTRMVASPAPAPAPAAMPATPPPAPRPAPRPRPLPKPVTKAPAAAPAVTEVPTQEAPAAEPNRAGTRSDGTDPQASLLAPPPLVGFGGVSAPAPVPAPLPVDAAASALQWAAQRMGDAPVRVPPAARLNYRTSGSVGGQSVDVATTLRWRHDGQAYESDWSLSTPRIGDLTRTNTGLVTPHGLLPVRAALRPPSGPTTRFDYGAGRVHFAAAEAELVPGMQDRLGVLIQLAALFAGDAQRYPVGAVIELPAAHARGPGRWRFAMLGEESVPALGSALPSAHLMHEPQSADDARVEVWLGRQLDYLPVRVRITEANGDTFDHTVETAFTETVPGAPAR